MRPKEPLQLAGSAHSAVKEGNVSHHGTNLLAHEWIMRATKHHAVHFAAKWAYEINEQIMEVWGVKVAALNTRCKPRAGRTDNLGRAFAALLQVLELIKSQCHGRRHHKHPPTR